MLDDLRRKEAERAFHNDRFGGQGHARDSLNKWYPAIRTGYRLQSQRIIEAAPGARILEYGCSDGWQSLIGERIAEAAAEFYGIDISDKAIEQARHTADSLGLRNCRFDAMDAETMTYRDGHFDLVFGRGIIHHLDLERAYGEISRVLRAGGKAIFYEPMGHNPVINGFRKRTPDLRTSDEHPLLMKDFRLARRFFRDLELRFFGLTTLAAVPFEQTSMGDGLMHLCEQVDRALTRIPGIRQNAWYVLATLTK